MSDQKNNKAAFSKAAGDVTIYVSSPAGRALIERALDSNPDIRAQCNVGVIVGTPPVRFPSIH